MKPTILDSALAAKNTDIQASFLKEWTPAQFKAMNKAIVKHFDNKYFSGRQMDYQPKYRTFKQLDNIMGLAYTSSSSCAGYWICNDTIVTSKHAPYHYIGFALGSDKKAYAILRNHLEEEMTIEL